MQFPIRPLLTQNFMCVTIDRVLDWILDLLTTYTYDSKEQVITAPSLIYKLYKSA
jgi:hypothetical protein